MGLFHCPIAAVGYKADGCILCGLCVARTRKEAVAASKILRAYLAEHASKRQKRYMIEKITVCGKGGVGKSTITSLLSDSLAEYGYSILVLDMDDSNPGLFKQFGFKEEPVPLMKLLERFSLDEALPAPTWLAQDKILFGDIPGEYYLSKNRLKFMMVGKIDDPFQGCACSMSDVVRDLIIKIDNQDKEIIVVDQEAGVESFGRGVERGVDTIVVIVEPSSESIAVAEKIRYMAEGIGITRIRAILNKMPSESVAKKVAQHLLERGIKHLGAIYIDSEISEASLSGEMVGESKARKRMRTITRLLLDESEMKYATPADLPGTSDLDSISFT